MNHHIETNDARQARNHNIATAYQIELYGTLEATFGRNLADLKRRVRDCVYDPRNREDAQQEAVLNYLEGKAIPRAVRDASCDVRRAANSCGLVSLDESKEDGLSLHEKLEAEENKASFMLSFGSGDCDEFDENDVAEYVEDTINWRSRVLDTQAESILDAFRVVADRKLTHIEVIC